MALGVGLCAAALGVGLCAALVSLTTLITWMLPHDGHVEYAASSALVHVNAPLLIPFLSTPSLWWSAIIPYTGLR